MGPGVTLPPGHHCGPAGGLDQRVSLNPEVPVPHCRAAGSVSRGWCPVTSRPHVLLAMPLMSLMALLGLPGAGGTVSSWGTASAKVGGHPRPGPPATKQPRVTKQSGCGLCTKQRPRVNTSTGPRSPCLLPSQVDPVHFCSRERPIPRPLLQAPDAGGSEGTKRIALRGDHSSQERKHTSAPHCTHHSSPPPMPVALGQ